MKHTLIALVEDRPGAINRVLGLLRGRGLVVRSIALGESETPGVKRATVLLDTSNVDQAMKQLNRLIEVLEVTDVTNLEYVVRETALVKIHAPAPRFDEIRTVAEGFGAKIIGSSPQSVVVQMTDTPDRLGEMIERAKILGACETMRSGSLAMALGGGGGGEAGGGAGGGAPRRREEPAAEDNERPWWSQADGVS